MFSKLKGPIKGELKCTIKVKKEDKRTFESGAVRDSNKGKGRCDLLPLDVICELFDCSSLDNTLKFIKEFQDTGDYKHLVRLLESEIGCIYDDLLMVSHRFEEGSYKYGDENWKKGIPTSVYIDSGIRHYLKHKRGDSDEPHRIAFLWNIMCCVWTCKNVPEMNVYLK